MNRDVEQTYAGVPLHEHVARILGRRPQDVLRAARAPDSEALELLAQEVLNALKVEHTDHDADYHGFYSAPFPSVGELVAVVQAYARTLSVVNG